MLRVLVGNLQEGELKTLMQRVGTMFESANNQFSAHVRENIDELGAAMTHVSAATLSEAATASSALLLLQVERELVQRRRN